MFALRAIYESQFMSRSSVYRPCTPRLTRSAMIMASANAPSAACAGISPSFRAAISGRNGAGAGDAET
jgi:hypothetical protein